MDRIKEQSNKVSQLVFAPETGDTYKKTLALTWDILRETGLLVWLVICLVFVGTDWFWNNSIKLGRNARAWYNNLGSEPAGTEQSLTEKSQSLLEVAQSGAAYLLVQARQQLGMPQPTPEVVAAPTPTVPKVVAPPTPVTPAPVVETSSPAAVKKAVDETIDDD